MAELLRVWPAVSIMITIGTMYSAVWLFVRRMSLREDWKPRFVGFLALLGMTFAVLALHASEVSEHSASWDPGTIVSLFGFYTLLPVLVCAIYKCEPFDAMLCAAAGYTMQNLASSCVELVRLLTHRPPAGGDDPLGTMLDLGLYAVVYLTCYHLFVDQASRVGLGHGSRAYLVPMVAVMVVVIAFDVLVKTVAQAPGIELPAYGLRVVHVATCAFTLYAEYEIVFAQRLHAQVASEQALRVEEERLWELSQRNMDAINARVHDMRHAVLRELAASEANVDRDTLAQIGREIHVYDAQVRTGFAVLDTVLSERNLLAEREGVRLAVIADGKAVANVPGADLYALVSGMIDACIGVAQQETDMERREVSFMVRQVAGVAALHAECPAQEDAPPQLVDLHHVADRLGATLTATSSEGTYAISVLLPA